MIGWGESALWASMMSALAAAGMGLWLPFIQQNKKRVLNLIQGASFFTFFCVLLALVSLVLAFLDDDFSLVIIAENSHSLTPWIYKLVALWGNHEGSMVLWLTTLSFITVIYHVFVRGHDVSFQGATLGLQHVIYVVFLIYTLFFADPFARTLFEYNEGLDLNPLLQDPAMIFHPPGLYLGFVGSSLLFSITLGGMLCGHLSDAWIKHVRYCALSVWSIMILGVASGSWWAYYELGWGGWWFWDPVENVALVPFLLLTAFIHVMMIYAKSGRHQFLTLLLGWGTFAFVLVGTFFVRSGLLMSVHSFAADPLRCWALFGCCSILVFMGLAIHVYKTIPTFQGPLNLGERLPFLSRGGLLLLFSLILLLMSAIIVLGTLYPPFVQAVFHTELMVGASYYEVLILPLALLVLGLGAPSFMIKWPAIDIKSVLLRLQIPLIVFLMILLFMGYATHNPDILKVATFAFTAFFMCATGLAYIQKLPEIWKTGGSRDLVFWRSLIARHGKYLAHMGFGVSLLGMSVDTLWKKEALFALNAGDHAVVMGYDFSFDRLKEEEDARTILEEATVTIRNATTHEPLATLLPKRQIFVPRQVLANDTALYHNGLSDYHLTLGENLEDHRTVFKLQYHPFVSLIWIGALMMMLGGVIICFKPRKA
ncbi:MAG: heme lyase CcmF/NrfE family subunit [Candidatus Nucleicultricaceae bacterium]